MDRLWLWKIQKMQYYSLSMARDVETLKCRAWTSFALKLQKEPLMEKFFLKASEEQH